MSWSAKRVFELSIILSPDMTSVGHCGLLNRFAKAIRVVTIAAVALLGVASFAEAQDRSLKLYFVHTGEKATITYKRNGRFDQAGLQKVNRLLRDFRRNESGRMDPRLLDIVWEIYDRSNARDYIHVVSGYRSPATNAMLRGRSRNTGVGEKSLHMQGKAMDFYIPGVKLSTLRALAMQMQAGGVGYYPTSGSPFVHVDVGGVRAWPRMSRQELVKLFPDGKTLHIPPDGRRFAGYNVALADYRRRVNGQSIQVASATRAASADSQAKETIASPRAAPAAGSQSTLVTAMLPVPTSRPATAFDIADKTSGERVDVAEFAIPMPTLRPEPEIAAASTTTDPIMTASLGAVPSGLPSPTPADPATAVLTPTLTAGFSAVAPDFDTAFKEPKSSIASLRFEPVDIDDEEELDSQDILIGWAISPRNSQVAMFAPELTRRVLMDHTADTSTTRDLSDI
jgi:uncharacterized protein YcbK (DUF882 family)